MAALEKSVLEQYKGVYIYAQQVDNELNSISFELLGKARGADRVIVVDDPQLEVYRTEPYTHALASVIQKYKPEIVLVGATSIGRDLGPRVSARVATGLTADCTSLDIGDFPLTRYKVCLMARTSGSLAALRTKLTTGSKLWYGWWSRISPLRILVKILSSFISSGTGCGVYFGVFKWSNPSRPYIFIKKVRSSGPDIWKISSELMESSFFKIFKSCLSTLDSISRRMASPH